MRNLVLLRGIPASGKSTWIKENHFEGHTLCLDDFRVLLTGQCVLNNPEQPDNNFEAIKIDQRVTKQAVELLHTVLEERMKDGKLVIVDATHLKNADIDSYKSLTKKYRCRTIIVDFPISKEEAILRDSQRPLYKQVGANTIERLYNRQQGQNISKYNVVNKDDFKEAIKWRAENYKNKTVNVIGDIHGCKEPLENYFKEYPFSKDEMYVFLGDYLDRGKQNKETLEYLIELSKNDNCIFLEGNHEKWLNLYAYGKIDEIKSKEFLKETMPQIENIDKSEIRGFCRNLRQILMFEQNGQTYILSHGGIPYCPKAEEIPFVPTQSFIKGVGGYERDIDEDYKKFNSTAIQIHGHRNMFDSDGNERSVNLEGKVGFGGDLKIWRDGKVLRYRNNYKVKEQDFFNNPLIKVNELGILRDGSKYYSCNFTKRAFYDKRWDDITTKARGLFIAEKDGERKIIARGYDKFFNIGERQEDSISNLNTKQPIIAYKKENGFLGIVSCIDNELHFFSKSTDKGDYAQMCKEQVLKALGENAEVFKDCLNAGNKTAVFEIIDVEKDPHIIEYDHSKAVLLDLIDNSLEFRKVPYKTLKEVAEILNIEVKQEYREWKDFETFKNWYNTAKSVGTGNIKDLEGLVIESDNYMCKMKFDYYLNLKELRKDMECVKNGEPPKNKNDITRWMQENSNKLTNIIETYKEYQNEARERER